MQSAHSNTRFTPGETYYRHKETHVLYGKGMVQANYLNPELEEMIALGDGETLVPVQSARSQVGGQINEHIPRPRTPPRKVPRFDATKSELNYKYNPQDPHILGHVRMPDAAAVAAANQAAEAHARHREQMTQEQLAAIQKREQADLNARALYATQAATAAAHAQLQQPPAAPHPLFDGLPLDLNSLVTGSDGQ